MIPCREIERHTTHPIGVVTCIYIAKVNWGTSCTGIQVMYKMYTIQSPWRCRARRPCAHSASTHQGIEAQHFAAIAGGGPAEDHRRSAPAYRLMAPRELTGSHGTAGGRHGRSPAIDLV